MSELRSILPCLGCRVLARRPSGAGLLGSAWLLLVGAASAEPGGMLPPPVLLEVVPPGAEAGTTTRVELRGSRLDGVNGLLANHSGFTFRRVPAPTGEKSAEDKKASRRRDDRKPKTPPNPVWEITVPENVPPGMYELRAYGPHGISLPRAFHIGSTRLVPKNRPRRSAPLAAELDARYSGHVERNEVEAFALRAKASQRVVVECYGERMDSAIDATLAVVDASGKRIAYSMDRIGIDPILAFDAEAEEEYRVELWDLTYQGGLPYLLAISTAPRVLCTYPPLAGAQQRLTLYGWNLPGGRKVPGRSDRLELVERPAPRAASFSTTGFATYRHTGMLSWRAGDCHPGRLLRESAAAARAPPFLLGSPAKPVTEDLTEVLTEEKEPNDTTATATPVKLPAIAAGRFSTSKDRDWYVFEATKGTRLEVEVVSARLGYRSDPIFVVARVKPGAGDAPPEVDDIAYCTERKSEITNDGNLRRRFVVGQRDPSHVWRVDRDGRYAVQIRNRNGQSGATAVYALRITPARPRFELYVLASDNQFGAAPAVRRGGAQTYDVLVDRRGGLDAPIRVEVEGLGKGLAAHPLVIAPDEGYGPLVISAGGDAPEWTGTIRVRGTAVTAGGTITREAVAACTVFGMRAVQHPLRYTHSRLCRSLPVAARKSRAPFRLELASREVTVAPGMEIKVPVKLVRDDGFDGAVRLSYHGLREKSFPNQNGERRARQTLGKGKSEGTVELQLSNRRPTGDYTLVVFGSAEFPYTEIERGRSRKRKFWYSTAARPLAVKVRAPVEVSLDMSALADTLNGGQKSVELVAGGEFRFPVRVDRMQGAGASVELHLRYAGNKKGLSAPEVQVPDGANRAELVLSAASDTALEVVKSLQIVSRVRFRGRTFEEQIDVPFRLARVAPSADPNTTQ